MANIQYYFSNRGPSNRFLNEWDLIALFLIFAIVALFGWGAMQMTQPYSLGTVPPIQLDSSYLPIYAIRTVLRMGIALFFSLLFTFTVGAWAAKSKRAEKIIVPLVDVLQSIPVLSFLSISIPIFIALFPDSLLGPECASILAIFTAQAWNMVLGFYQTLRTVPADLHEVSDVLQLNAWQRFWRVEVPFSMPGLLWNMMMSLSASWFFVVASEAISVSNQKIRLPGIGSYIQVAIDQANMQGVVNAILTMLIVILIYDQLVFRPLMNWSEKFKIEPIMPEKASRSWVVSLLQRTKLFGRLKDWFIPIGDKLLNIRFPKKKPLLAQSDEVTTRTKIIDGVWSIFLLSLIIIAIYILYHFITTTISLNEIEHVLFLGLATATRVVILIILSSIIWVPIGVKIGMHPRLSRAAQPIVQFIASFPANLLFPIVVMAIVKFHLNVEIWTTPLMILGSQWYILFNVIAGASTLPKDLYQVANNFNVRGWQWWRRLGLPAVFPYYVTGAITAAGGAWNASIVAEWVSWGDTSLKATGLGAYINEYTAAGDFPRIALGTGIMCIFVLLFNRVLWRPLYRLAENRFGY